MAKKRYVVTMARGGISLPVEGEKWPKKHCHGAIVELDDEVAHPFVLAGKIRAYDKGLDATPTAKDSDIDAA